MTQALALIGYFVLLMASFLATRSIVIRRGWAGALLIAFLCSVVAAFFAQPVKLIGQIHSMALWIFGRTMNV